MKQEYLIHSVVTKQRLPVENSQIAHSIILMKVIAQKVVVGKELASIKPMPSSSLSYVTL